MPSDLEHANSDAAKIDLAEVTDAVPAVRETDPERIATLLWNEGKADEAIEYLESVIATERRRRGEMPAAAASLPALLETNDSDEDATVDEDATGLEPVSDWRKRHRAALSPAQFNAFGNSTPTIDITPKADDAILPPKNARSLRRTWLMALLVVAVFGASAAAALWSRGDETPPVAQPAAGDPAVDVAVVEESEADLADSQSDADMIPPPEEEIALDEATSAPPDDAGLAPPSESVAAIDAASEVEPLSRPADLEPETTASIDPLPSSADPAPVVEPRLPRQRPDVPEGYVAPRPVPVVGMSKPVVVTPDVEPLDAAMLPSFDPMNPPPTLTPAEYQALLARRAWAADYAARRRALAESRAMDEPLGLPIIITQP